MGSGTHPQSNVRISLLSSGSRNMKVLVLSVLLAVCLQTVLCQETEGEGAEGGGGGGGSAWEKMKSAWKSMVSSVRKMWNDLTEEIKARAVDMKDYSKEMVETLRAKMNEIIDSMRDVTQEQKDDMKKYVERFEMETSTDS